MVWNIPLASLGQLSWLCPLPASCAPPASSLKGQYEKLKSPWLSVSTAQQQLKRQCVISILLILNPKHSTTPATRIKINAIPAETRTAICSQRHPQGMNRQPSPQHSLWEMERTVTTTAGPRLEPLLLQELLQTPLLPHADTDSTHVNAGSSVPDAQLAAARTGRGAAWGCGTGLGGGAGAGAAGDERGRSGSGGLWELGCLVHVPGGGLSPSPSPPQLSGHSWGCPSWAQLQLRSHHHHAQAASRQEASPTLAQGPCSPHGKPQPSPQLGHCWSRDCTSQHQHGRLAAPCPRPTAPGMPWGTPSCCLTLRGHRPQPGPAPTGPWPPPRCCPGLGPELQRSREEEGRGAEHERGVGQGDEVAAEGQQMDRGTGRMGESWSGSGGRKNTGEELAQG